MRDVRPTSGRVLLALFNILGAEKIRGADFLDLFAGTGRVGLSAIERGAASVTFVESVRPRASAIERAAAEGRGNVTVLSLEVRRALAWLAKRGRSFGVIFADPPYGAGWGAEVLAIPNLAGVLTQSGVLVVEHAAVEKIAVTPPWAEYDERSYGRTSLTFFKKMPLDNSADLE
ncbi:MAG: RsmD family RNA methyltransferase [Synergistaceae bacterium]|jgi:16S rRNA (guanine(966)-N(2))-methyltransferase RsmD|nr:RsmD family RNA methyltransferase [Synergistaceae bacterium]